MREEKIHTNDLAKTSLLSIPTLSQVANFQTFGFKDYDELYRKLGMRDGEKNTYKLAKDKRNENKKHEMCQVHYRKRSKSAKEGKS